MWLYYLSIICCRALFHCSASAPVPPRQCYSFSVLNKQSDPEVPLAASALNLICFAPQESSFRSISLMCTTVTSPSPWRRWCPRWLPSARRNRFLVTSFHRRNLCPIAAWRWPQRVARTSSALPKEPLSTTVRLWRNKCSFKSALASGMQVWIGQCEHLLICDIITPSSRESSLQNPNYIFFLLPEVPF